ncbi:hypothetical protein ACLOJK_004149 [Asimina triloba]
MTPFSSRLLYRLSHHDRRSSPYRLSSSARRQDVVLLDHLLRSSSLVIFSGRPLLLSAVGSQIRYGTGASMRFKALHTFSNVVDVFIRSFNGTDWAEAWWMARGEMPWTCLLK